MKQTIGLLYHKVLNQDLKSNENYANIFLNIINMQNKILFKMLLLIYFNVSTLNLFYNVHDILVE